jgi:competence protein ComEA
VGEVLAQRILDDRAERGPYRSVDDLRRVKGIGEKTLEKLRPWLVAVPPQEPASAAGSSAAPDARR